MSDKTLQEKRELAAEKEKTLHAIESAGYWQKRAEKAEDERDALKADAERYRWLRDHDDDFAVTQNIGYTWETIRGYPSELDATIDAAIDAARKEECVGCCGLGVD